MNLIETEFMDRWLAELRQAQFWAERAAEAESWGSRENRRKLAEICIDMAELWRKVA
jgi:hypothetical protein